MNDDFKVQKIGKTGIDVRLRSDIDPQNGPSPASYNLLLDIQSLTEMLVSPNTADQNGWMKPYFPHGDEHEFEAKKMTVCNAILHDIVADLTAAGHNAQMLRECSFELRHQKHIRGRMRASCAPTPDAMTKLDADFQASFDRAILKHQTALTEISNIRRLAEPPSFVAPRSNTPLTHYQV
jgi:hypothetical protein